MQAPIHCRRAGVEFFAPHIEPVDISFGGLRLYSDEEHPVGAVLLLEVFFPRARPVAFRAQVMWIKALRAGQPARFDLGLAFVELSPDAMSALHPFLSAEGDSEAPESGVDWTAGQAESAVEFDLDAPVSEVRPVAPEPTTVLQGAGARTVLSMVPVVAVDPETLRAMHLDCRAGFLISRIDGVTNIKGLLDLSGMPTEETLVLLDHLRRLGIVELR